MRPFLKWAGNKYAVITRIQALLPDGGRLIEPFAGSLAVFLNTDYPSALLSDANADIISLYRVLQKEGEAFIRYCAALFTPANNAADAYYAFRQEFNATEDERRKAALFLYLNRHGYNGLCRYNSKGGFNVPMGRYVKPYFPALEMRAFHAKSQTAQFAVSDFKSAMLMARPGDVVYCDPPYVPLSRTANFTSYHREKFGEVEQCELALLAEEMAARGIPVIVSNHDTAFTAHAYRKAVLTRFAVRRSISSKGRERNKAEELLAVFT